MRKFEMNNQKAMEYAMYMIAGSYFDEVCNTRSRLQETKLNLYYKEEPYEKQYQMEELCMDYIENYLKKLLPESIWEEKVEILLKIEKETGRTILRFEGWDFYLELQIHSGKVVSVRHKFYMLQEQPQEQEILYIRRKEEMAA